MASQSAFKSKDGKLDFYAYKQCACFFYVCLVCRYSTAEKETAMVKVEEMIKLQKKAQDQMKRLVRVILELVQCVRYKRSERNFSFNCLKVSFFGCFFSSALLTIQEEDLDEARGQKDAAERRHQHLQDILSQLESR